VSPIGATEVAQLVRSFSGAIGIGLTTLLGSLLLLRLFSRELAAPLPRRVSGALDGSIALLFVLFILIVVERFHVLG
jgi:hypothetical protein